MVKTAAIILVIVSSTMIGFLFANRFGQRVKELRIIYSALKYLETEIIYGLTPIPIAFETIGSRIEKPIGEIFIQMSQALRPSDVTTAQVWLAAWRKSHGILSLRARDYDILYQLGHTLGQTDKENQMKHINMALTYLQSEEADARNDQQKHEKMYKYLGFLTGMMIVILMI
ncbi:stage III sporulation protein AB [Desulfuribacillus stibiiarsenatis]|uniref:Stage III sporulation protein AB n=1 Tax=Desulfuribacillus stibiiarsenatis TaxID=1390249 RepID=A0A1E5L689_9FIRM|nr:stage III sporulation protein SpoIIIAB [Desulfuribacillus stibiiarsenatis]OEH85650.1 stage III sporulation protein AB [Desulfuribacillus stibiiarsenatis]